VTAALIGISLWVVLAFVMAVLPSSDHHWRRAYVLIALGLPLLVWVTWQGGVWALVIGLVAGCAVLRWPLYYLWRYLRRIGGG
jgi:predicted branched-subunit amino acid permease